MLLSGYRNFKHRGGQYCSIGITIMKRSTATVRENVNVLVSVPKCKDNPTSTSRTLETSGQHTQLQSTIYIHPDICHISGFYTSLALG